MSRNYVDIPANGRYSTKILKIKKKNTTEIMKRKKSLDMNVKEW